MENGLQKKYGLFTAICMVVGIVIGSGVFFKAQSILQTTSGNMVIGVWAWIIGGVIMLCCITAFAVLATKYEKVNGLVDYGEATVGPKYGYALAWFSTFIYFPSMTGVLAWVSARYTMVFITSAFPNVQLIVPADQGGCVVGPECIALALILLCGAYALNALSPKLAGHFQVSTTVIKMIPLFLMAVVGIIVGLSSDGGLLIENFQYASTGVGQGTLFSAVVATAFAYEGWIIATSINAEIKDSKKNLPIALLVGGVIIVITYVAYYIGVAGGASVESLMNDGATIAFTNIFGSKLGLVLNLFIAISCMGTLNGLMVGSTRAMYAMAARKEGPRSDVFGQIDPHTNMPSNSAVIGLLMSAVWLVYFYGANLGAFQWFGLFSFDSSELPIVTVYGFYIPIFINFMRKATDLPPVKRFVIPTLGLLASIAMVCAAIYAHGIRPYQAAAANGTFSCPVLFYIIVFAVVMAIGFAAGKKKN
ncbi:MAG: APC family permease [Firmicutes bacterium]|nr:APC family permease [Bacillota bacterium]